MARNKHVNDESPARKCYYHLISYDHRAFDPNHHSHIMEVLDGR